MSSLKTARLLGNQPQFSREAHRALFFISLAVTLPVIVTLLTLNRPLQNETAPQGVVSLEMARTVDQQNRILNSWNEPARLRLAFSIGLDFFCVVVFTSSLVLACIWLADASHRHGASSSNLGLALAWALGIMGVLWILQNTLLAAALFGHATALTARITFGCALLKFAVMMLGLAYMLGSVAMLLRGQFRGIATHN